MKTQCSGEEKKKANSRPWAQNWAVSFFSCIFISWRLITLHKVGCKFFKWTQLMEIGVR